MKTDRVQRAGDFKPIAVVLLLLAAGCGAGGPGDGAGGNPASGSGASPARSAASPARSAAGDADGRPVAVEGITGQRWAVLVGVNDYAELGDLQYCKADAAALRDRLVEVGFPEDNVILLADGAGDAGRLPLKGNIEDAIRDVLRAAGKGDLVLVSFSGHGVHLDGKTFLCPTGAKLARPDETMIALADVYRDLDASRASRKLLWVDACRDDPRPKGSKSAAAHAKSVAGVVASLKAPPEGILTLASCKAGQVSWEERTFGHGLFMHYLLEGLAGKADQEERGNRDRRVSILELYNYANIKTTRFTLNDRQKSLQTPELFGKIIGDFDIVEPPPGPPKELTNSIGVKLKLIPAGEFLMGSPESEKVRHDDEGPQHRVRITRPFYLGVHEVTVGQFREFVEDTGYKTEAESGEKKGAYGWNPDKEEFGFNEEYSWRNAGFPQADEHPVVNVSWNDAREFCRWLSRKEDQKYRLPTEAEWEYACRAGTTTRYYHGDDPEGLAKVGNVADGTAKAKFSNWTTIESRDGYAFTAPVGSFRANGFGLYDMHGNVWEWCANWYDDEYYAASPVDDPKGPATGSRRVIRGGSWNDRPRFCRSAFRSWRPPVFRNSWIWVCMDGH